MYLNKNYNRIIVIGVAVITLVMVFFATKTKFDYDFEQFFPEAGEETQFFNEFRERYGSDNDFLIIAFENKDQSIYNTKFLNEVDTIANQIKQLESIEHVQVPTQMNYFVKEKFLGNVFEIPYLHKDSAHLLKKDSLNLLKIQSPVKNFLAKDGKGLYMLVKHTDQLNDERAFNLLTEIRSLISENNQKAHLGGRIVGHTYYIDLMQRETIIFVGASVVLIVLFLIITFRSLYGVLIPFAVVAGSVVWIMGAMGIMSIPLNLVLNIMPTILMVVGISGVVHFLSKYLDKLREGYDKKEAIRQTMKQIGTAIFFTSVTTMIGFLSLMTANIPAIFQFGLITACGVGITMLLALTFLPSVLNMMKQPKLRPTKPRGTLWDEKLHGFFTKVTRFKGAILAGSVVLIGVCIYGTLQIKTNNYIMEDLKKDNPLKAGYEHLEEKYNGARPFDMNVEVMDTSKNAFSKEVLAEVDKLQDFIERNHETGILFSPVTVFKEINVSESNGNFEKYELPEGKKFKKAVRSLKKNLSTKDKKGKVDLSFILSEDKMNMRITGTMGDIGSFESRIRNEKLDEFIRDSIDTDLIQARLTNGPHLMQLNNQLLTQNIVTGLLIAFVIIGFIVGITYRSFKMVLLSLVPNIVPLIMIGAIMGFAGIDMKISTSLVFTIAFGIAVDDTIHFLSTYKFNLNQGLGKIQALKRTFISTGKAIVLTTLILSGGFLTLAMSDFLGTFYIGFLISLTLVFAVFADLILLPVLIIYFFKPKEKQQVSR